MAEIKGTVGDGGANAKHDVALVQLMLRLVANKKGVPYYNQAYTGTYDTATKDALAAFQKDQSINTAVAAKAPAPGAAPAEKSGLVAAGSNTFAKLNGALPAKYASMRIIPNTTTVYLPAPEAEAKTSAAAIAMKADLDPAFRQKAAATVTTMYADHKVALNVVGPGWRRTFAVQAAQTKTGAGPGESNHNFGRAVDLGFGKFVWIAGDGSFVQEGGWLGSAKLGPAKSEQLWAARDAIALKAQGIFLTNFQGERVHLQSFPDGTTNARRSLAKLLTAVGALKWQVKGQYQTDLGLGAHFVNAGTSKQIWAGGSPITGADVAAAAAGRDLAALAKDGLYAKLEAVKKAAKAIATAKAGTIPAVAKSALTAQDITQNDLKVVKAALKADLERADVHWNQWAPVP